MAILPAGSLRRPVGGPSPRATGFENRYNGDGRLTAHAQTLDSSNQALARAADMSGVINAQAREGAAWGRALNQWGQVAMQRLEDLDEAQLCERMTIEKTFEHEFSQEQAQREGKAAIDDPETKQRGILAAYKQYYDDRAANKPKFRLKATQERFDAWMADRRLNGLQAAAARQVREEKAYRQAQFAGSYDLAQTRVGQYPALAAGEASDLIRQWNNLNPEAPDETRAAKANEIQGALLETGVLGALASHDTAGARRLLGDGELCEPVAGMGGLVSSGFGHRDRPKAGASTDHKGVDLAVPVGTPVRAMAAGTVVAVGDAAGGYGKSVTIDHGNGLTTLVGHLSGADVRPGDKVAAGQVIALSGNTGNTTGPHTHFEVRQGGQPVDPLAFFGGGKASPLDPEKRLRLMGAIEREEREQQAAAAVGARGLLGDLAGHLAGIAQDGQGYEGYEDRLRGYIQAGVIDGDKGAAAEGQIAVAHDVYDIFHGQGKSFREGLAEFEARRRPSDDGPWTPEKARAAGEYEAGMKMIGAEYKRFMAQPLDYVAKDTERRLDIMMKRGEVPEGREMMARIEAGRAIAQELGGLSDAEAAALPALTTGHANQLRGALAQAKTPEEKRQAFEELDGQAGPYMGQVMADLGLGYGWMLNTALADDNPVLANIALAADGLDRKTLGKAPDEVATAKATALKRMGENKYLAALMNLAKARPDDAALRGQCQGFLETLTNVQLMGGDLKKINEGFNGRYEAIDDDEAQVVVEKGQYDAGAVRRGLKAVRAACGAGADYGPGGLEWASESIWRNDGQGGAVLMLPDGLGPRFSFDELAEIGGGAPTVDARGHARRGAGAAGLARRYLELKGYGVK